MRVAILLALLVGVACGVDADVSRAIGARCDRSTECEDRCLTASGDWPGGFCTLSCATDQDCPEATLCIREDGAGACLFTCADDRGCAFLGSGYACSERPRNVDEAAVLVCRG